MTDDDDRPFKRQRNETSPLLLICVGFIPLITMAGLWVLGGDVPLVAAP